MSSREWDYALKIRGCTPRTMPMLRLADYLREFAGLLGDEVKPTFAGVVSGSLIIRARQQQRVDWMPVGIQSRLKAARHDREAPGGRNFARLNDLLIGDSARGAVLDRGGNTIVDFPATPSKQPLSPEYLVHDEGFLDGVVVGIVGVDDTMHLRLKEATGEVRSITVRDLSLARCLAGKFRGDAIRVHVHGTWKRTNDGKWEPHALYVDRLEDLDGADAGEVFRSLAAIPGNGWATEADPVALLRKLRSDD